MPLVEHLNAGEAATLLSFMKGQDYRGVSYYEIIAAILYCGMRVNEAVHLTKKDVLWEKGLLVICEKMINGQVWRPKTKATRFVPIPQALRPIIAERMKTQGELLFANSKGHMMNDRTILIKLKDACSKAGIKSVHTHSLRHTFTSVSSEGNIPEVVIQEVLGHKSADMTRRYRHMRPDYLVDRFNSFDYGKKKEV